MKFIVDNRSVLSDREAFGRVIRVIDGGKISKTKQGPQYCFLTVFNDGCYVSCIQRAKSQTFVLWSDPNHPQI